jgi:Protein of unknown function (DUF3558)
MSRVLILLMLAAVLTGCSSGSEPPTGDDSPSASSPSSSTDPISAVQNPKNLAGTPPCALLTSTQLAGNRIDLPGQPKDVLGAPGCVWNNNAHTREVRIYVDTSSEVLHNIYTQRETFPVFEITQIAAHPAIQTKNNLAATSCTVRVAAAEKQTFVVVFTSLRQGLEEPCGPARALAEAVIGNLPPLKS